MLILLDQTYLFCASRSAPGGFFFILSVIASISGRNRVIRAAFWAVIMVKGVSIALRASVATTMVAQYGIPVIS